MINKLSNREKLLLVVLLIVFIFYGYFVLLISPVLNKLVASRNNIVKYREKVNSEALSKIQLENNKKKLAGLKSDINKSFLSLPEQERDAEIIYNLKVLSKDSGVSLNLVTFGEPIEFKVDKEPKISNKLMYLPAVIQITGGYKNIISFISSIEESQRIAIIDTFTINEGNGELQGSISIQYLFMPSNNNNELKYDFNNGVYGKDDLFK